MLKTHKGWVCLCDLGFHAVFSPWGSALPGVARQRTFLASPRKVSRRPQESLHTKVCHPSQAIASRRRKPTRYAKATLAGRTSACKRMPLRRHGTMFREFPASPQTCLRRWTRLTIVCLGNARCGYVKSNSLEYQSDSRNSSRLCLVFHCADAVCAGQKMEKEVGVV